MVCNVYTFFFQEGNVQPLWKVKGFSNLTSWKVQTHKQHTQHRHDTDTTHFHSNVILKVVLNKTNVSGLERC